MKGSCFYLPGHEKNIIHDIYDSKIGYLKPINTGNCFLIKDKMSVRKLKPTKGFFF